MKIYSVKVFFFLYIVHTKIVFESSQQQASILKAQLRDQKGFHWHIQFFLPKVKKVITIVSIMLILDFKI